MSVDKLINIDLCVQYDINYLQLNAFTYIKLYHEFVIPLIRNKFIFKTKAN